MRAIVVSKITSLEHYRRKSGLQASALDRHLVHLGVDAGSIVDADKEHRKTLEHVFKILERNGVRYKHFHTDTNRLSTKGIDIVIAVGGDGTILSTSHLVVDDTPFLGVNSDAKRSRGSLAGCDRISFEKKLSLFLKGKCPSVSVSRIEATLAKQRLPFALNDVFISGVHPEDTVKYTLAVDGKTVVRHMCSGLIVSTGAGSTAWVYNASKVREEDVRRILKLAKVDGRKANPIVESINASNIFERDAKKMRYFARDIIAGKTTSTKLQSGFAKTLTLHSNMYEGKVVIDSKYSFDFSNGKVVKLRISDRPLRML